MLLSEYRAYLKRNLEIERQNVLETWAGGAYTGETSESTTQLNARALGFVEALNVFLEYLEAEMDEED